MELSRSNTDAYSEGKSLPTTVAEPPWRQAQLNFQVSI